MTSKLKLAVCAAAALSFAAPAFAQDSSSSTDTAKHHAHHAAKHKGHHGGKMAKGESDSTTARLNEQSLQNAKSGAASGSSTEAPASSGAMAPPASSGSMAPPPASGSMAPPPASGGTMAPPSSGTDAPK